MRFVSVSCARAKLAIALCLALGSRAALAQTGGAAATPPTAAPAAAPGAPSGPLQIWLDAAGTSFDKQRLRASLAHELGRDVVFTDDVSQAAVQIRLDGALRADVHYKTPSGEELSRSVDLPPDRERSVQVVSWLTVNLVRDEASELLDELRARRKEEAEARAAEDKAATDKAAADKAAVDKAAADKAAADKAARGAEQAKKNQKRPTPPQSPLDALLRESRWSFDVALATPLSLVHDSPKRELKLQLALAYGESGAIRGIAVAPGVLRVRRDLSGIALAAGAVLIGGKARGIVAAAGGAFVGDVNGVVVAAGVTSAKSLRGIQVAGGLNTARDLDGIALGPINVHRRVKGLQLGIVNVAEQVDGASLGILSFAKNGRVQPVVWGSRDGSVHVAIKSIAGYCFTQLGGGINLDAASFSYDAGVGAHLRLSESWFFEPGVHYSGSHETADASGSVDEQQLHYLAGLGLRLGNKLDLFAAAGVRHTVAGGSGAPVSPEVRAGIAFF